MPQDSHKPKHNTLTYPIVRYQFEAKVNTTVNLPGYSGAMLRGAFGHALRRISCVTNLTDCTTCILKQRCPYTIIFEPHIRKRPKIKNYTQLPALCIFEPMITGPAVLQSGEHFYFSMVLIGEPLEHISLIIMAWKRALSVGLGKAKKTNSLQLTRVCSANENNKVIWSEQSNHIVKHQQTMHLQTDLPDTVSLNITTPMRLQRKGKVIRPAKLNAMDLIAASVRRLDMIERVCDLPLTYKDTRAVIEQARNIQSKTRLVWTEWQRYSQRQQQKMTLGGVTGHWALSGDLAPYKKALLLGQWIHVGKNTTFGMGHYHIQSWDS